MATIYVKQDKTPFKKKYVILGNSQKKFKKLFYISLGVNVGLFLYCLELKLHLLSKLL